MDPHPGRGGGPVSAATVSQRWGGRSSGFSTATPAPSCSPNASTAPARIYPCLPTPCVGTTGRCSRQSIVGATPPFAPTTLSAQSVAALARAHLTGQAPVHRRLPLRLDTVERASDTSIEIVNVELDTGYYDRGIVARRDAHSQLEDVTDILDAIEDETDRILADLLAILDGAGTRAE